MTKRKALFIYCQAQKRDVCFLQETHSCKKDGLFWQNQWGGKSVFSHSSCHFGGVTILFDGNFKGEIIESHLSSEGRWFITVVQWGDFTSM